MGRRCNPARPHLDAKIERAQRMVIDKFGATAENGPTRG
jgi:hypothetical protein